MADRLGEIEKKLDSLVLIQNSLLIAAAEQRVQELAHQKSIERFWSATWPSIIDKLETNSMKIVEIEVSLAKVKTAVILWGSFLVGLIAVVIPLIVVYIEVVYMGTN